MRSVSSLGSVVAVAHPLVARSPVNGFSVCQLKGWSSGWGSGWTMGMVKAKPFGDLATVGMSLNEFLDNFGK